MKPHGAFVLFAALFLASLIPLFSSEHAPPILRPPPCIFFSETLPLPNLSCLEITEAVLQHVCAVALM